ncbi:MAG TPA: MFS transporter [Chloroflexia bacterium]|nr:MFS transporter [Chloroflexia bacterium]
MKTASKEAAALSVRQLFGIGNFWRLWLGQTISDFGDGMTTLTLIMLVNHLTGSTAALALLMIVLAVPQVTLGLIAGVYVDRLDRRKVMLVSDSLRGLLVLGLVALGFLSEVWPLYLLAFLQAAIGTFFTPARSALMASVLPEKGLLAANSFSQMSRMLSMVLGTGIAGVLVGVFNTYWVAFVVDAITFFLSCWLVSGVKAPIFKVEPKVEKVQKAAFKAISGELIGGFKVIRDSRSLLGALLASALTMLGLGAVNVLLVPLIINDLHVEATWFGAIDLAQTTSMIMCAALLAFLTAHFKPNRLLGSGLIGLGVVTAAISQISDIWHLIVILFLVGWLITPVQAATMTIMQTGAANEVRGRVAATNNSVFATSNLVSMGLAGALGDVIGVRNVFVVSGLMCLLGGFVAIWLVRNPAKQVTGKPVQPVISSVGERG